MVEWVQIYMKRSIPGKAYTMKLSERLIKITEYVKDAAVVADIGTDHGYVPVYCVEGGLCQRAIACDINEGPLNAARENIHAHNLSDCIVTRLSDGLDGLEKGEADVIVIAGMGGFLIRDILMSGADKITDTTRLILQPMVAVAELREYLKESGFEIEDEKLAREDEKFYNILSVKKGRCDYDEREILFGRGIEKDENYGDYMAFHKNVIGKILAGLEKSTGKDEEIKKYRNILDMM